MAQPVITELARRIGATGTFNLVGPHVAGGVVRKRLCTYSSLATPLQADITALGPAVENEVWTITLNAAMTAGVIGFGIEDADRSVKWVRAPWTTDIAGTLAALNVVADAIFGTGGVVIAGTATAWTITYTAGVYLGRSFSPPLTDITGCTGPASITSTVRTTEGHSDAFATGSFIMPVDGSENPCALFLGQDGYAISAIDELLANRDISVPNLVVSAGYVVGSHIINWPTDTALIAWLKAQLRLRGTWVFEDDFVTV
jgi:hypothetical protein